MTLKIGLRTVVGVIILGGLIGCGVKSQPVPPDGSKYPRQYPSALPPLTTVPDQQKRTQAPSRVPVNDPDSFYQYPNTPPPQ